MSADSVLWLSIWQKLGWGKWFPDDDKPFWVRDRERKPVEPRNPDFPSQAKDYSGACLFDSNAWIEEQLFLSPQPISAPSRPAISTEDTFLLKSCKPLPIEQVVFAPTCPVLQHQPRIGVSTVTTPVSHSPLEVSAANNSTALIPINPVALSSILESFFLIVLLIWLHFKYPSSKVIRHKIEKTVRADRDREAVLCSFLTVMFKLTHLNTQAAASQQLHELRHQKTVTNMYHKLYQCFRHGYAALREKYSKLEELVTSLKAEKVALEKDKKDLQQQLTEKHVDVEKSWEENTILETEKIQLTADLRTKCHKLDGLNFAKADAQKSWEENTALRSEKVELTEALRAKRKELEELNIAKAEAEADLQEDVDKLTRDATTHAVDLAALKRSLSQSQYEVDELRSLKASAEANLQNTNDKLAKVVSAHDGAVTELQGSITQLTQEVGKLNSKLQLKDDETARLNQQVVDLEHARAHELKAKDREIASLKEQLRLSGVMVQTLEDGQADAEKTAKILRERLNQKEDEVKNLQEKLSSQSSTAKSEQQQLRNEVQALEAKSKRAENETEALREKLTSQSNTADIEQQRLNAENQQLKDTLSRTQSDTKDLEEKLRSQSEATESEQQRLQAENEHLEATLSRAESVAGGEQQRLYAENQQLKDKLSRTESETQSLQEKFTSESKTAQSDQQRLCAENQSLQEKLTSQSKAAESEQQRLRAEIQGLQTMLSRIEPELKEREASVTEPAQAEKQVSEESQESEAPIASQDTEAEVKDATINKPAEPTKPAESKRVKKKFFESFEDMVVKGDAEPGDLLLSKFASPLPPAASASASPSVSAFLPPPAAPRRSTPPTSSKEVKKDAAEVTSTGHYVQSKWAPPAAGANPARPQLPAGPAPPKGPKALLAKPTAPEIAYARAAGGQSVAGRAPAGAGTGAPKGPEASRYANVPAPRRGNNKKEQGRPRAPGRNSKGFLVMDEE